LTGAPGVPAGVPVAAMKGVPMDFILGTLLGLIAGAGVSVFVARAVLRRKVAQERQAGEARAAEATQRLERDLTEAREQVCNAENRIRNLEKDVKAARIEVQKREERLSKREEVYEKKVESLNERENEVSRRERAVAQLEKGLAEKVQEQERLTAEARKTLERIAGMNQEEARRQITARLMDEVKLQCARDIKQIEEQAREEAEMRAKRIVGIAIARYAGEYTSERTVSAVQLPNEEMKGRIIGREGRNIRVFEAATGVDVIIDDAPDAVVVSAFDPVRREVARLALERLVADGRIHPARIEEVVEKVQREVEQKVKAAGEEALFQLGLTSMHPELVKMVGQMRYRTSYGQNVLAHSIEVGFLASLLAAEMGVSEKDARRAGLLHDLGKAVSHEVEGPHAISGANFARKFGESAEIVHAIAAHHEEEKPLTLLAHIIIAADAISGARPGARRESLERYVQRLTELEAISNSFAGVERSFAIQAGREIRVLVENGKVSDEQAAILARDIAAKIEEKLAYPGQIRVCVIRETRATAIAK